MLINVPGDEVSDTTKDDSSSERWQNNYSNIYCTKRHLGLNEECIKIIVTVKNVPVKADENHL